MSDVQYSDDRRKMAEVGADELGQLLNTVKELKRRWEANPSAPGAWDAYNTAQEALLEQYQTRGSAAVGGGGLGGAFEQYAPEFLKSHPDPLKKQAKENEPVWGQNKENPLQAKKKSEKSYLQKLLDKVTFVK